MTSRKDKNRPRAVRKRRGVSLARVRHVARPRGVRVEADQAHRNAKILRKPRGGCVATVQRRPRPLPDDDSARWSASNRERKRELRLAGRGDEQKLAQHASLNESELRLLALRDELAVVLAAGVDDEPLAVEAQAGKTGVTRAFASTETALLRTRAA